PRTSIDLRGQINARRIYAQKLELTMGLELDGTATGVLRRRRRHFAVTKKRIRLLWTIVRSDELRKLARYRSAGNQISVRDLAVARLMNDKPCLRGQRIQARLQFAGCGQHQNISCLCARNTHRIEIALTGSRPRSNLQSPEQGVSILGLV